MKPSFILSKVTSYKLTALATDLGYIVEVNNDHLHGVEDNEGAFVGVRVYYNREGRPELGHDFWFLVHVKPSGTVRFSVGRNCELFSDEPEYKQLKDMENRLRNNAFLNSTRYSGKNEHIRTI